jgi:hypothetical protein
MEKNKTIICASPDADSMELEIRILPDALSVRDTITLVITGVTNPAISGTTGTFRIETLSPQTYLAINQAKTVAGIMIEPGTIEKIDITPQEPMNLNLIRNYTIEFRPHAPITAGGEVEIEFPPQFQDFEANSCLVLSGLVAATGDYVTCTLSNKTVILSNFQTKQPGKIKFEVRIKNPAGTSTTDFKIRTKNAADVLIDQNLSAGVLTFNDINAPLKS